VECGLLLDVVVRQGAAILQLLAGKDQALLVWGNTCGAAADSVEDSVSAIVVARGGYKTQRTAKQLD
jgi:hypothetical protein